jgi:DNA-binding LacI/PurR family transcriptional regulator
VRQKLEDGKMKELTTSPYKYREICDMILARIATGELRPGSRLPSARALGEEYGCNYHTVRRAFEKLATQGYLELKHGSGTFITESAGDLNRREANTEKVLQTTDKIGVLLPLKQWGHYVTSLIDHLNHSAEKKKIKLNIRTVPAIDTHSVEFAQDFINQDCCAIILPWLGEDQNLADLHDFVRASNLPVVLANPVPGLEEGCYLDPKVDLDIFHSATYLQCRYFKEIGYKKIALLGPDTVGADYWQRNLMLYSRWCDIEDFPSIVGMVDRSPDDYERILTRWETHRGEIAVIAYHDEIAVEFMQACEKKGLSVPSDFAVLGHNNNPLGLRSNPPLSTLLCPFEYVSDGLIDHAIALSKGSSKQLSSNEPQDFFIRESCGGRLKYGDEIDNIVSRLVNQNNDPDDTIAAFTTKKISSSQPSG